MYLWPVLLLIQGVTAIKRPNIVFILTDDQDVHMHSLEYMPLVQKHLMYEGTTFTRHYCTTALCCPARVSLLTGMLAHNTNVTDIFPPFGGYPKFISEGHNKAYLPIWLQEAGYSTYYVGKLLNAHEVDNYNEPVAAGWTQSDFLLDPYTYEYENGVYSRNGGTPVSYKGQYSPDVTAEKAYEFLDEALHHPEKPFFLGIAPIAPHGDMVQKPYSGNAPKYAKRHAHLFKDYKIPRTENFNPENPSGVSWIATLPRLNDTVIEYNDEYQRCRLRALQSVDEMVGEVVRRLEAAGELDNTYIFYTTDNGYHISQHRMHPGKSCGFETDINVPMIVRGPGMARDVKSLAVTSHTDIAPTIMFLAGGEAALREQFDGSPMPLTDKQGSTRNEHVGIEYWGHAGPEGKFGFHGEWGYINTTKHAYSNNTYKGLRLIGDDYSIYYSIWCTDETELYDVIKDPGQVHNLLQHREAARAREFSIAGRPLEPVLDRLNALIMMLKDCKGESCRNPWGNIHRGFGKVANLADALDPEYDTLYAALPKLKFLRCEMGYFPESEGGQFTFPLGLGGQQSQSPLSPGRHWSDFT